MLHAYIYRIFKGHLWPDFDLLKIFLYRSKESKKSTICTSGSFKVTASSAPYICGAKTLVSVSDFCQSLHLHCD